MKAIKTNYKYKLKKVINVTSSLGEGLFVDKLNEFSCWVDIDNNLIYFYDNKFSKLNTYIYPYKCSNIFFSTRKYAIVLDDHGIRKFYFNDNHLELIFDHKSYLFDKRFRSNDGIQTKSGDYFYGSMHIYDPSSNIGDLFFLHNGILNYVDKLHIPNTFIEIQSSIFLVSDSLSNIIYCYEFKKNKFKKRIWYEFENCEFIPDGGFMNLDFVFISIWSKNIVRVFNLNGDALYDIDVYPKYPTNCKKYNKGFMLTSASNTKDNNKIDDLGYTYIYEYN